MTALKILSVFIICWGISKGKKLLSFSHFMQTQWRLLTKQPSWTTIRGGQCWYFGSRSNSNRRVSLLEIYTQEHDNLITDVVTGCAPNRMCSTQSVLYAVCANWNNNLCNSSLPNKVLLYPSKSSGIMPTIEDRKCLWLVVISVLHGVCFHIARQLHIQWN